MRFRYTTPSGDEVEVRDLDELREHVESGRVSDETPLVDDITGESGEARSHQAYRFVQDVLDVELTGEDARIALGSDDSLPDLGITLADSEEPESVDEVVARLEKERASDDGIGEAILRESPVLNLDSEEVEGDAAAEEVAEELPLLFPDLEDPSLDAPEPVTAADAPAVSEEKNLPRTLQAPALRPERAPRTEPRAPDQPEAPEIPEVPEVQQATDEGSRRDGRPRRWSAPPGRAAGLALALAGVAYLALQVQAAQPASELSESGPENVLEGGPPPLDPSGIADRMAASEGIAFQHMVGGMDSLARAHGVFRVPNVWLEGAYLADAGRHPAVEAYWERYLGFVEDLRRQDATLFRHSFVARMESLDLSPSVISLRTAQAMARFRESQGLRDSMYAHMEDLARSSLGLHDLLVARDDQIQHTPVTHAAAVRDPFLQIYTEDRELQEEIYKLLDRIFDNLEALHGETRWTRSDLTEGVLESLRVTGGA